MSNREDYEKYAMHCLIECYDKKLKPMLDCKNERPDWQSNELKLGIEVTEAMPEGAGEKRSLANRYHESKVLCDGSYDKFRQCVVDSIKNKTQKLNNGYKLFENNWLVVGMNFRGEFFEDDIQNIIDRAFEEEEKLNFSKIFIISIEKMFVIEDKKLVDLIEVNEKMRKKLKDLSKQEE